MNKSVLDGVPVDDKAFPLNKRPEQEPPLTKVSACPTCGAPIYGAPSVFRQDDPVVKFSCNCKQGSKSLDDLKQTK